jgi:hypothetical protein
MNPAGAAPAAGIGGGGGGGGIGGVGGGGGAIQENRLFQAIANGLRQNWNPEGWRRELQLQERVQTIMEMYVRYILFCFRLCFFSYHSLRLLLSFLIIVFFECPFHLDFHFHSLRHHHNPLLLHPPPLFLPAPVTPHFIAFIRVLRYTLVRWQQIPLGWPLLLAQHTTLATCLLLAPRHVGCARPLTHNSASSLRLVRADVEQAHAIQIATTFEKNTYEKAKDKVSRCGSRFASNNAG